jgi:DNA polymerase-1
MGTFLLFDGNAILHRAFHALPPLTTKHGEPIGAVYGMMSMLIKLASDFHPTYVAFAFDTKEPTFRNKLSVEYQAQRAEVDTSLISQFQKARDTLKAFHIPYFERPGYEADDLIGTIAAKLKSVNEVDRVIVVTGDRDLLQLVDEKTNLFMPAFGLANGKLFGREETKEKMGVYPESIVDYKALVGDPSDNYKGVPGVGPKTAIGLIEKFGSVENILQKVDELPKSAKEKIENNKESAELSKTLATIVRDIDVPEFSLEECKKWRFDSEEGISLFEEYGFNTLTKRVKEAAKQFVSENQTSLF